VLLRRIKARSGRTGGQIIVASGLRRATVHYYLREANTSFPRSMEFVEKFCRACKLDPDEVETVVRIWHRLGGIPEPLRQPQEPLPVARQSAPIEESAAETVYIAGTNTPTPAGQPTPALAHTQAPAAGSAVHQSRPAGPWAPVDEIALEILFAHLKQCDPTGRLRRRWGTAVEGTEKTRSAQYRTQVTSGVATRSVA
ncbi:helix-turn-helix domain-containing protein, partial [Streptomyces sp. NPDC056056]|uniref:helix-turn-helix domain-containing protein n=1 Tax=Streptomyces sp. NPDC056056 TaxID=3345698 RepID=UPI0035DCF9C8